MIPVPKDAIDEIGRLAAEVARLRERVAALEEDEADLALARRARWGIPRDAGDPGAR